MTRVVELADWRKQRDDDDLLAVVEAVLAMTEED